MIPDFDPKTGQLPPGIHEATWNEFVARFGTNIRRRRLIDGLKLALDSLKQAGCKTAYIDGSFVTSKVYPKDFDACWDAKGVKAALLDEALLFFDKNRELQKQKYDGDIFPAQVYADSDGQSYLSFFQIDRQERPKGIIALSLEELP
jgi:hypothetical protein